MEIIGLVIIGVVLWYFNSTLARGAELAETLAGNRMDTIEGESIVVNAQRRAKTTKKAMKMIEKGDVALSNKELRELLKSNKGDK